MCVCVRLRARPLRCRRLPPLPPRCPRLASVSPTTQRASFAALAQATAPSQRRHSAPIWPAVEAAGRTVTDVTAAGRSRQRPGRPRRCQQCRRRACVARGTLGDRRRRREAASQAPFALCMQGRSHRREIGTVRSAWRPGGGSRRVGAGLAVAHGHAGASHGARDGSRELGLSPLRAHVPTYQI